MTATPVHAKPERRPLGVTFIAALGVMAGVLAIAASVLLLQLPPATLAMVVIVAAVVVYASFALFQGRGWARLSVVAIMLLVMAAGVGIAIAAGTGAGAVLGGVLVAALGALLASYLVTPEAKAWFTPVDWAAFTADFKWFVALVLLVILGLAGATNADWQETPEGREDIGDLVETLLAADRQVFLLQLLGVLLVAALIAAIVIAMRDRPEREVL